MADRLTPAQAKQILAYRRENERYRYYVPNGKCELFIKTVGQGEAFVSLLSAANGVGKTACGANIVAHLMFPCSCEYFNHPIFKEFPFIKKGRIASDPTTVTQQLVPELQKWLPRFRYQTSNESKNYPYKWVTDTEFEFDLMTYEQDPKEFESVTLGWAWFDEPPPEEIYKATVSRMRRGGIIFITQTPLKGSAWLYDRFVTSPDRIL